MKDMKYDAGKPRPSLILKSMSRALLEVSKVATFGAEKYAEDSWLTVEDGEKRYRDAKDRHMLQGAFETVDSESGISHLAHEAWNALALLELSLRATALPLTREQIHARDWYCLDVSEKCNRVLKKKYGYVSRNMMVTEDDLPWLNKREIIRKGNEFYYE